MCVLPDSCPAASRDRGSSPPGAPALWPAGGGRCRGPAGNRIPPRRNPLKVGPRTASLPPAAPHRLTESPNGQLTYQLPIPAAMAPRICSWIPRELIEKLCALIAPPRVYAPVPWRPGSPLATPLRSCPALPPRPYARWWGAAAGPVAAGAPPHAIVRCGKTLLGGLDEAYSRSTCCCARAAGGGAASSPDTPEGGGSAISLTASGLARPRQPGHPPASRARERARGRRVFEPRVS